MTKDERKQLTAIEQCFKGQLTVKKLALALDVSEGGLGNRIVSIMRKYYGDTPGN